MNLRTWYTKKRRFFGDLILGGIGLVWIQVKLWPNVSALTHWALIGGTVVLMANSIRAWRSGDPEVIEHSFRLWLVFGVIVWAIIVSVPPFVRRPGH